MREKLRKLRGKRVRFIAKYEKYSFKPTYLGWRKVVLLKDVCDEYGNDLCDHVWVDATNKFDKAGVEPGCIITFTGVVKRYRRGYMGKRAIGVKVDKGADYKIFRLRKIEKL